MRTVKSFDIFETLVTRPFAPPHKLFPLVATIAKKNHNISIDPDSFEEERVLAEKRAGRDPASRKSQSKIFTPSVVLPSS
jgi:hypothetical protein